MDIKSIQQIPGKSFTFTVEDTNRMIQALDLGFRKMDGQYFDAYVFDVNR